MAAQTVHYMNGNSKTLTHSLLANLFKGNAAISLLPYTSSGVVWNDLSFSGADQIYTLRDSFQISQEDPTEDNIQIDQLDEVIDTATTPGAWNFSGNLPTVAQAILEVFYKKAKAIASVTPLIGQKGTTYSGESFFASPQEVYATILVESGASDQALAFAKVKLIAALSKDDASTPAYVRLTGTILANDESTGLEGDWAQVVKFTT